MPPAPHPVHLHQRNLCGSTGHTKKALTNKTVFPNLISLILTSYCLHKICTVIFRTVWIWNMCTSTGSLSHSLFTVEPAGFPSEIIISGLFQAIITWEAEVFRTILNSLILSTPFRRLLLYVGPPSFKLFFKKKLLRLTSSVRNTAQDSNSCSVFNALMSKNKGRALAKNAVKRTPAVSGLLKEYQMVAFPPLTAGIKKLS